MLIITRFQSHNYINNLFITFSDLRYSLLSENEKKNKGFKIFPNHYKEIIIHRQSLHHSITKHAHFPSPSGLCPLASASTSPTYTSIAHSPSLKHFTLSSTPVIPMSPIWYTHPHGNTPATFLAHAIQFRTWSLTSAWRHHPWSGSRSSRSARSHQLYYGTTIQCYSATTRSRYLPSARSTRSIKNRRSRTSPGTPVRSGSSSSSAGPHPAPGKIFNPIVRSSLSSASATALPPRISIPSSNNLTPLVRVITPLSLNDASHFRHVTLTWVYLSYLLRIAFYIFTVCLIVKKLKN